MLCVIASVEIMDGETQNQVRWRTDAEILRLIGSHIIATGVPTVEIRIPASLADLAKAAWDRDDEQDDSVERETHEQAHVRGEAATLALIGLALAENGRPVGEDVIAAVSADLVGQAVTAVDLARG
jgi:hypothetical protein